MNLHSWQTRIKHGKSFSPCSYFLPPRARVPLSPPQPPHFTLYVEQEVECGSEICTGSAERTCTRRHTRKNQQVRCIFVQIKQPSVDLHTRIDAAQGRCVRARENDIFSENSNDFLCSNCQRGLRSRETLDVYLGKRTKTKAERRCRLWRCRGKKNRRSHVHISLQSHSVRTSTWTRSLILPRVLLSLICRVELREGGWACRPPCAPELK